MSRSNTIVPPAPKVHAKDLPMWRFLLAFPRNTPSTLPDYAFDVLISRTRILGVDVLLINDPEGVRQVMATAAQNYVRPVATLRVFRPLAGGGVLLAQGSEWRRQRRLLAPVFTPAIVGRLLPHFAEASADLVRCVENQSCANLSAAFQEATLEAVLRALFSLSASDQRNRLADMVRYYVSGPGKPNVIDGPAKTETGWRWATRRRQRFQHTWFAAVGGIVAERKRAPVPDRHSDLLALLLAARDPEMRAALDDAEVCDQCATMLVAGFETTSRWLFWATYLLCLDPTEQGRLRTEIMAFPPERVKTLDDLLNWPRSRRTLLEALRLYPPAPHITRDAIAADTVMGEEVRPGMRVWISPWIIHRHRKFWEHPTAFIPDRFTGKPSPWTTGPFLPFGAGPRICIGAPFAMAEA
jgi:cytochrome P450